MYNQYFGFREAPFNVTPDPGHFYANRGYEEAYSSLLYGIRERKGFLLLTGEVGTGKTTILQKLMEELESTVSCVFFYNTNLTFSELLTFTCEELGLAVQGGGQLSMISALNTFLLDQLSKKSTAVLIIDEAQNIQEEVFENLRLLSNLETPREKLLQIVLAGQPELETKLDKSELRQLKQRIFSHSRLSPLNEDEISAFIAHRLRSVGHRGNDLFPQSTVREIARYSKGTPRVINIICDNALLIAYADSQKKITPEIVREVAQDLRLEGKNKSLSSKAQILPIFTKKREERNGNYIAPLQRESIDLPETITPITASSDDTPLKKAVLPQGNAIREDLSKKVMDNLNRALTEAMGPMAGLVIKDRLAGFGSYTTLSKSDLEMLIALVSSEILDDVLRARFQATMDALVGSLNGNHGSIHT
jgi:general secretion pathway protein A